MPHGGGSKVVALQNQKGKVGLIAKLGPILLAICVSIPMLPMLGQDASATTNINEDYSMDSPHDYPNNYVKYVLLQRPGASKICLMFSKIDTEANYDYVKIIDQNMVIKASYSGYYTDWWTPWITGSKVYIALYSDYSNTDWGYHISQIICEYSDTIESPHNYPNLYSHTWEIPYMTAHKLKVRFEKIDTEQGSDYVKVYDSKHILKFSFSGYGTWISTDWIVGSKIYIEFTANDVNFDWGFKVYDIYAAYSDDDNKFEYSLLRIHHYDELDTLNFDCEVAEVRNWFEKKGYVKVRDQYDADVDWTDFWFSDDSDILIFMGHGSSGRLSLTHANNNWWTNKMYRYYDYNDADGDNLGEIDLEWYIFLACKVLKDTSAHLDNFLANGAHGVLGYTGDSYGNLAPMLRKFFSYIEKGKNIYDAWIQANLDNSITCSACYAHRSCLSDRLLGWGVVNSDTTVYDCSKIITPSGA